MKLQQVSVQIYSARDHLKTAADVAASFKKLRAIGYTSVESFPLSVTNDELKRALKEAGVTLCSMHESADAILHKTKAVVANAKALNCSRVVCSHPGGVKLDTPVDVNAFAKQLNAAGKSLLEGGVTLCYHNHHNEFRRIGGRSILEALYAETDPRFMQAELDTFWVQHGGGDPVDWCRRMKGRLPLLHIKDFGITADSKIAFAEIGNGNLNWKAIIPAAEASGCEWFIVEQDDCPGDPFDSLTQSFAFVKKNLCVD